MRNSGPLVRALGGFFGSVLFPIISTATPITGTLQMSGGAVVLTTSAIKFSSPDVPTGGFMGLAGTPAAVKDISFVTQPINTPFLLQNFVTFGSNPNLIADLTFIDPGVAGQAQCAAAPAPGQRCTPAFAALVTPGNPLGLAPYTFLNTSTGGSTASIAFAGTVRDVSTGATAPMTGTYTMQFGQPFQSVLASFFTVGSASGAYSAQFTSSLGTFSVGAAASISTSGIDFQSSPLIGSQPAGAFLVEMGSAGSFTPLVSSTGHALDIAFLSQPLNIPFLYQNFLTFPSDPDITFDLTRIFLGVEGQAACAAAPAVGQACTPAFAALVTPSDPLGLSPLNLENLAGGGSAASFSIAGQMRRISTSETSPYSGVYTTQFDDPYQFLLAAMVTGGGLTGTYSATLTTPVADTAAVPEPTTLLLIGPAVIALYARRRQRVEGERSCRRCTSGV